MCTIRSNTVLKDAENSSHPSQPEEIEFPAGTSSYDPRIAWWLAKLSKLAYDNKITIATRLKEANFNHVEFFDAGGTQAFLAVHPGIQAGKFAVLAFRGTEEDSIDILTNIRFAKRLFPSENLVEEVQENPNKPSKKFYAHGGFLTGVLNVWGCALNHEIKETFNPNYKDTPETGKTICPDWKGAPGISEAICALGADTPLYFTGHSLGGALATLAAYKTLTYRSEVQITALYTFGSPRAVHLPLAEAINKELAGKIHRVVNYTDVVPRVPPRVPGLLKFHHIDAMVYFTRNKERRDLSWLEILVSDVGILLVAGLEVILSVITFKLYTPRTIEMHKMDNYIEALKRDLPASTAHKL